MTPRYAEVALGIRVPGTFDYRVPRAMAEKIFPGCRVWVPFRTRRLLGIVVGLPPSTQVRKLKEILEVLDPEPLLPKELIDLGRWVAGRYLSAFGATLPIFLPGPLRRGRSQMKSREKEPSPLALPNVPWALNKEQQAALSPIREAIDQTRHEVFLLHGVTGSGKTEIYLQAIESVLRQGKSSIILVPEIALTPQATQRFQGRFGALVAVLHSRLLPSTRIREWERIRSGEARVVVGTRLAVFAPVKELGLLVVDEEQETSYKQEEAPRYHAREVAIERGRIARAPVVLGSATPSLESFHRASEGPFKLLRLTERIEEVPMPQVEVVDMRQEESWSRHRGIFSHLLMDALDQTLKQRQQAILFLNRRGFATFVQCRSCGRSIRCKTCQVSLTYHQSQRLLLCHYCHAKTPPPDLCPHCRKEYIRFQGVGTQRVESELARFFPQARIARLDTDAARPRGSHAQILGAFQAHELDVLVGTQMVAKGLDIPRVTLVGIVSADTALNLPDFRSAERTFQLLTQVAGRAGRGSMPGRVVIQTHTPHHYAIQAARQHDYAAFYRQEIEIRRSLGLPPFARLVQVMIRAAQEAKAQAAAASVAADLKRRLPKRVGLLGPAPCAIPKLRRFYRWQVLLKTAQEKGWDDLAEAVSSVKVPSGARITVDVDPL
ncbi:MAG: primosomal protein N' [Candidatus Omnitrophica bacterium]|nr:primosomal protein N' [Candidatus Omnitrophota bacterium]